MFDLIILLFLLICLTIVCVLVYNTVKPKKVKPVFETFEFDFDTMCMTHFYTGNNITDYDKTCLKNNFYGNQVALLNWTSSKDKDNYICFYYVLQASLKSNDGNIYTNNNFWITIYDKKEKNTAGTARWSNTYQSHNSTKGKASVPFGKSIITATSGNLSHLQNAEIITDYRNNTRKLYIFTKGSYVNKDYENYKKSFH